MCSLRHYPKWLLRRCKNHAQCTFISTKTNCCYMCICFLQLCKSVNSPHFRMEKKVAEHNEKNIVCATEKQKEHYTPEDSHDFDSWIATNLNQGQNTIFFITNNNWMQNLHTKHWTSDIKSKSAQKDHLIQYQHFSKWWTTN